MGIIDEASADYARLEAEREARRAEAKRAKNFYASPAWRRLRYEVLIERGRRCECCGRAPPDVIIDVDHIKPRSKYPALQLVKSNMQVSCRDCNFGKSNRDETDWSGQKL